MINAFKVIAVASMVLMFSGAALAQDAQYTQDDIDRDIYLSVGLGSFTPSSDYEPLNGSEWENGPDVNLSFAAQLRDMIAGGIDLHYSRTEVNHSYGILMVNVTGAEFLAYLQQAEARFQPYVALGLGVYFNSFSGTTGAGMAANIETGMGLVLKGGARMFITENLFLGGNLKLFSDESEYNGQERSFGGTAMNLELGVAF